MTLWVPQQWRFMPQTFSRRDSLWLVGEIFGGREKSAQIIIAPVNGGPYIFILVYYYYHHQKKVKKKKKKNLISQSTHEAGISLDGRSRPTSNEGELLHHGSTSYMESSARFPLRSCTGHFSFCLDDLLCATPSGGLCWKEPMGPHTGTMYQDIVTSVGMWVVRIYSNFLKITNCRFKVHPCKHKMPFFQSYLCDWIGRHYV